MPADMEMSSTPRVPVETRFLPFARPDFDNREIEAVTEVMQSGWLTTGARAALFETQFAEAVGAKHAVAVNSCTAAMHLALEAIGIAPGDEIITTTYTFAATAEVIRYFGATPVFVDIDSESLNIDPAAVERAVTPRTRAVLPVHIAGLAADLDGIRAATGRDNIPIIEDAAHAFPATYRGRRIGSISEMTCFSFYATKTITTGEGGMVCTDSDEYAERCRMMSLHGLSRNAWSRYTASGSWRYDVVAPGFKYNLTDLAAAIGIVQLGKAAGMQQKRQAIAEAYDEAFSQLEVLQCPARPAGADLHAWHLYPLRLHLGRLKIGRDEFIEELRHKGIGASVHFIPLHLHSYYRDTYGLRPDDFPIALAEYEREVSLPIYSRMSSEDIASVITAVTDVVRAHTV